MLPGCIACTECLPVCPEDCIVPDTEIYDILPDLCTGCYKCARVCPVDVCVPYHKVPTQALVRAPSYLAGLRVDVSPGTSSVRKLGGKER
ncbi:MAG: 4Fe-4S dicluster domain-containing protein [Candidatus Schekmanbacteria bacterium]|nr:4Fe-4S dicluster domain-containing protein [Candidatus Schekmanbacteria bacterium]